MARKTFLKKVDNIESAIAARDGNATSAVIGVCGSDKQPVRCYRLVGKQPVLVNEEPDITIPLQLEQMLFPTRYIVAYGGRGSGKTRSIVAYLVERARTSFERILCLREIQRSISESSFQEISDEINRRGLGDEFKITESRILHHSTGSSFTFVGMYRNVTQIKGYAGTTIAWIEEAESVSQRSWDILSPTIRAPGSQILVSFNPAQEDDPTYQIHVAPYVDRMEDGVYSDDDHTLIRVNYNDNPWFTDELEMERLKMQRTDPDRYAWIWLGQFLQHGDAQVLGGKWVVDEFDISTMGNKRMGPRYMPTGPYFGADFGYSSDPSTLVRCWVFENILYIDYAIAKQGLDIIDLGDFYLNVPGADEHTIYADNSRPETIAHMRKLWTDKNGNRRTGFNMQSCSKWPGSIEDGIAHLRSYEKIVIHPRCKPMIHEAQNYKYKVDPLTDEITTKIVDKDNHCVDALRYALEKRIGGRGGNLFGGMRI